MIVPLVGMPQGVEWLVILFIVVLVFGAAKLPDLARGTGQALRIFKTETKGLRDDEPESPRAVPPGAELPPATPPAPPVAPPSAAAPPATPPVSPPGDTTRTDQPRG